MRVTVDSCQLMIDLTDLVEAMSDESKAEVAKHLAFNEFLFKGILEAVAGGKYPSMWDDGWSWSASTHQEFRDRLMELLPKSAQDSINHLKDELCQAQGEYERYKEYAWALDRWLSSPELYERPAPIPTYVAHHRKTEAQS